MSQETFEWLNSNVLIGFTDKRGTAWHYRAADQGEEPNHYPGSVPIADLERRLFFWDAVESIEIRVAYRDHNGEIKTTIDEDRKAIVRPDTQDVFGYFKLGYIIHQYREWLVNNISILLDSDLEIGSAGLLAKGARAWVQVEMPETCTTPEGVQFRPFLSAATSLDGSLSTTYTRGAQVISCDNTLSAALTEPGAGRVKIRHSRNSLGRIQEVREALDIVHQVEEDFSRQVTQLCRIPVTSRDWNHFLDTIAPVTGSARSRSIAERKRADLVQLWRYDESVAPWSGTAYGVVQAVNTYTHHHKTVRGTTRAERNAERAVTGGADKLDMQTIQVLEEILAGGLAYAA